MLEYRIIKQFGDAQPFSLWTFTNYECCLFKLDELIFNQKQCLQNKYFVTNDFYNNEFQPIYKDIVYFTIECREVSNWKELSKNFPKKNIIKIFPKSIA